MKNIALITGASKGIGKALSETFARNGYSLILVARSTDELAKLQSDLKNKYQCESKIISIDLALPESIDTLVENIKDDMNNIEVLVNNAGYGFAKKFTDMTSTEVSGMMEVNIAALTKLTYRILPSMVSRKSGKILNLASTAAFTPGPYMAMYYASKAYVLSLSQALHEEYKKDGVIISALCPGPTISGFSARAGSDKSLLTSGIMPIMTAEKVAEIGYQGLMKGRRVIVAGIVNKITAVMMRLTPDFILLKITAYLDKRKD